MRIKQLRVPSAFHRLGLLSTLLGPQVVQKSMAWRSRKRLLLLRIILQRAGSFLTPKMLGQLLPQCLQLDQLDRVMSRTNLLRVKIKQGLQQLPKLRRKLHMGKRLVERRQGQFQSSQLQLWRNRSNGCLQILLHLVGRKSHQFLESPWMLLLWLQTRQQSRVKRQLNPKQSVSKHNIRRSLQLTGQVTRDIK